MDEFMSNTLALAARLQADAKFAIVRISNHKAAPIEKYISNIAVIFLITPLLLCALLMSGCAGGGAHAQMAEDVEFKIDPAIKTIYIETFNSSVAPLEDLGPRLEARFAQAGYQVLNQAVAPCYHLVLDVVDFSHVWRHSNYAVPSAGIGLGIGLGSWGPLSLGVGVGIGAALNYLLADDQGHYVMAAFLRISASGRSLLETAIVSGAKESDLNFQQGYEQTRDAIIDCIVELFVKE
jgi:hypothetical protein